MKTTVKQSGEEEVHILLIVVKLGTHCSMNYFNYIMDRMLVLYITYMMLEKLKYKIKLLCISYVKVKYVLIRSCRACEKLSLSTITNFSNTIVFGVFISHGDNNVWCCDAISTYF